MNASRAFCMLLVATLAGVSATHASSSDAAPSAPSTLRPPDDAAVKKALEDEMARSLKDLKLGGEAPPYFLRYQVVDSDRAWWSARLGSLVDEERAPGRQLHVEVRVGGPDDDNTNFVGSSPGGSASVSSEDDYGVIRRDLWQLMDREYKDALESFARKKASHAVAVQSDKDRVPDFSKAAAVQSVSNKAVVPSDADRTKLKELALKLSAVFKEFPKVDSGRVGTSTDVTRKRTMTSEKTWTDERRSHVRVEVSADTVADDGQHLIASLSFAAPDVASLPALDKMEAEVRALAKNLTDQRTAPQVDPGVASVIFEGQAAGQLARLLLMSSFSGQPIPRSPGQSYGMDGSSSFADKIGLVVAPKWLSVVDERLRQRRRRCGRREGDAHRSRRRQIAPHVTRTTQGLSEVERPWSRRVCDPRGGLEPVHHRSKRRQPARALGERDTFGRAEGAGLHRQAALRLERHWPRTDASGARRRTAQRRQRGACSRPVARRVCAKEVEEGPRRCRQRPLCLRRLCAVRRHACPLVRRLRCRPSQ